MNSEEARSVLATILAEYRIRTYADLAALVGTPAVHVERYTESGTAYQIEIEVFWDDQPLGDVRVIGTIDDGGWRAFVPLSDGFSKAPDGSFVGQSGG